MLLKAWRTRSSRTRTPRTPRAVTGDRTGTRSSAGTPPGRPCSGTTPAWRVNLWLGGSEYWRDATKPFVDVVVVVGIEHNLALLVVLNTLESKDSRKWIIWDHRIPNDRAFVYADVYYILTQLLIFWFDAINSPTRFSARVNWWLKSYVLDNPAYGNNYGFAIILNNNKVLKATITSSTSKGTLHSFYHFLQMRATRSFPWRWQFVKK